MHLLTPLILRLCTLISPFFPRRPTCIYLHAKLRSALSLLGGAVAIIMQSIVGEELAQGPIGLSNGQCGIRTYEPLDGTPNPTTEPPRPETIATSFLHTRHRNRH